jgi:hypothetical protein
VLYHLSCIISSFLLYFAGRISHFCLRFQPSCISGMTGVWGYIGLLVERGFC